MDIKSNITWVSFNKDIQTFTPNQLNFSCDLYATFFSKFKQDKVCILHEMGVDAICAFIGAIRADKVPCFYTIPNFKLQRSYFQKQFENLKTQNILVVGSSKFDRLDLDAVFEIPREASIQSKPKYNFMQFSSGTTGIRKRIFYSHYKLIQCLKEYANVLDLGKPKKCTMCSWLPHYHDMGLIASILLPLYLGMDIIYMDNLEWIVNPFSWIEAIMKTPYGICWQPNFAFQFLYDRVPAVDLSNIKFISCAEPIRQNICKRFEEKFATNVYGCYALAENIFAVTQAKTKEEYKGFRTSGKPFGSNKVKIKDGEILINSDYLFDKYQTEEQSKFESGWFYTGDTGELIDEHLYIYGRKDDIFKYNGQKVIPDIIENKLSELDGITPGRVVCFPYENNVVVLYEGSLSESEVLEFANKFNVTRCVNVPQKWIVKSSSGKISRKSCLQKFKEQNEK